MKFGDNVDYKRLYLRSMIETAKAKLDMDDQRMIDMVLELLEHQHGMNVSLVSREFSVPRSTMDRRMGKALLKFREAIREDGDWLRDWGFDPDCPRD